MIIGLLLLAAYPVAAVLAIIALVNVATLLRRRLHPLRILTHGLVNAGLIGVIGGLGVLPSSLWWAAWILPVLTLGAIGAACARLLVAAPPQEPTPRQRTLLRRPHVVLLVLPIPLLAAASAVPLVWG